VSRNIWGNVGNSHVVIHEVKSTVTTLLNAGVNAARASRKNDVRKSNAAREPSCC